AKDRIGPALDSARDKIVPAAGVAMAASKAGGRRAAVRLGLAEEPTPPKKGHKLRNLVILLGLGGLAAFVYMKLSGQDADPAWTAGRDTAAAAPTQPVPAESATAVTSTTTSPNGASDQSDTAPTAPLASEETVESPVPTTPDQPLEHKDL
ncbi:MAG: hypothetical protein QOD35_717, partial [Nocardioidaceae bacterium]|nr:hypothetical protein [Nocardioidaceae bacterium]